ncbi:sarcosine oxidase [Pseudoxanthobacter soli DSM 19599]|uniref:Sarcosine oxidase n=1 Tax=Pseudoxanthobacter soli DSM 19599 TaxID=1123029 RepID=A0A1M7ZL58_9HYPH|nr:N-methyl-L-tryptophan oxidase [Pseudoxanthobacter soli]SHO65552.1 sarcosine oxidase [Pseudoxanthobacter soli DSM 19599]
MTAQFDVAVIGLGAMGAAAAAHIAARGQSVVGIEAFYPAHELGSSHGDSRIIRLGYFEDPAYVPLLRRAYANWRALEARVREDLLTVTGVLQLGRPDSPIVSGSRQACELHGLPFTVFEPDEVRARFPAFALDDDEVALLEPEGGYLRPEAAVMAHLKCAARDGAVLRFGERVTAIEPGDAGVTIVSDLGRVRARKVVVATGPWIAELVPSLKGVAKPIKQVVAWFQPRDSFATALGRMPVFLRDESIFRSDRSDLDDKNMLPHSNLERFLVDQMVPSDRKALEGEAGSFFGFPVIGRDAVKVGKHCHFFEEIDPDRPNPAVDDRDTAVLEDFVARRVPGAAGVRVATSTCRYTLLPGENFLLDHVPGEPNIVAASPCSGHGYKFASVIGEILADLALDGGTALPVALFSFEALQRTIGQTPAINPT